LTSRHLGFRPSGIGFPEAIQIRSYRAVIVSATPWDGVRSEVQMQAGMHAIGWGLQRFAIVAAVVVFVPLIAYSLLVILIVLGQAVSAFGQ
jgi:hypothetical protein